MCSLHFENNFLTIEHVRFCFENSCLAIERVRFSSKIILVLLLVAITSDDTDECNWHSPPPPSPHLPHHKSSIRRVKREPKALLSLNPSCTL